MRVLGLLSVITVLSGCVETRTCTVPSGFRLAWRLADREKFEKCDAVAQRMGVEVADDAPLVAEIGYQVRISSSKGEVLARQTAEGLWDQKCAQAICVAVEDTRLLGVSIADFLNKRILREQAFKALADAAGKAETAFTLSLETPMDDIENDDSDAATELLKAVGDAHDAYRLYTQWPRALPSLTVLETKGTRIDPGSGADANRVPIPGTKTVLRVDVKPDRVAILGIETASGKEIISFDADMTAHVARDFRDFLVGDRIDIGGALRKRLSRGNGDPVPPRTRVRAKPASAMEEAEPRPVVSGGCTKDIDCKGNRVCERGSCVNPSK